LNVDPGTMNPFQHGEVYVLNDGAETDLDLATTSASQLRPLPAIIISRAARFYENVILRSAEAITLARPYR